MNTKKKYITSGFLLLFILISSFLILGFKNSSRLPNIGKEIDTEVKSQIKNNLPVKNPSKPPTVREGGNTQNIQITIKVLGNDYKVSAKESSTLYEAMTNLQNAKENNFSFFGKEYPSLGFFVEEINGIKESPGKYWLYYVNGKEAPVGVSKYIIKNGDIINWKQE